MKRSKNSTGIIKEVIDESDETRTSINEKRYTASTDSNLDSKLDSKLDSEIEKIHQETNNKDKTKHGDNVPETISEVFDETTSDHNDEKIVLLRRKTNTIKNRDHIVSKSIIIVSNSIIKSTKSQDEEVILRNSKKPRLKRVPTEIESSSGTGSEEDEDQDISNQTFTDSIDKVVDDVAVKTDLKKYQDEITLQKLEVYAC